MSSTEIGWTLLRPRLVPGSEAEVLFGVLAKRIANADSSTAVAAILQDLQVPPNVRGIGRQRLKVALAVVRDLRMQGWRMLHTEEGLQVAAPEKGEDGHTVEKERIRAAHRIDRDHQLREPATQRFIREMERKRLHNGEWKSIFSLIRDGREMGAALRGLRAGLLPSSAVLQPYLQLADDKRCDYTGFRLMDVWRYFRHTWATKYNSTPGRQMCLLVRDAATPDHAVVGILALGSAVVQLAPRDRWIGWSPDEFIQRTIEEPSARIAKWLLGSLDELIRGLYVADLIQDGLLKRREVASPSQDVIAALREEGAEQRILHSRHAMAGGHKAIATDAGDVHWKRQAKTYLFRSKRAYALADLLEARAALHELGLVKPTKKGLAKVLGGAVGRRAMKTVLRNVKARHAGVDMLDITVCGAVAPYSHVLGGKLVSLLAASPFVVSAYEKRYRKATSVIASAMAGKAVQRRPHLVLLGTTSLYGGNASQYNRLSMHSKQEDGSDVVIRYEALGKTEGYGSFHFSQDTVQEMDRLLRLREDGRRINSIFGEGVNPKLRKMREALEEIGFEPDPLLRHGSPRLVYAVPLAANFREVLLGMAKRPVYWLPPTKPSQGTQSVIDFWYSRWFFNRIQRDDVLGAIESHTLVHPVKHGARVQLPAGSAEQGEFDLSKETR